MMSPCIGRSFSHLLGTGLLLLHFHSCSCQAKRLGSFGKWSENASQQHERQRRRLNYIQQRSRELTFDDQTGLANVVVTCEEGTEFDCRQGIASFSASSDGSAFIITQELTGTDFFALSISKPDLDSLILSVNEIQDVQEDQWREFILPMENDTSMKYEIEELGDEYHQVQSYSHNMTEIPRAWQLLQNHESSNNQNKGLPGTGTTVCIIDTGYQAHVDVNATNVRGITIESGYAWDSDPRGHGTIVLGIIAASDNTMGIVGVAPGVDIVVVRMMDSDGKILSSTLAEAALRCHREGGADVISISLGGKKYSEFEESVFLSLYDNYDVLVVAAAGNGGWTDENPVYYPAAYPKVLSVGAVDNEYQPTDFSTYNQYLDITAPGILIASLANNGTSYTQASGTSMSAPIVSGIAALLKSAAPQASAADLFQALVKSSIDLGDKGHDDHTGFGLVNAAAALKVLLGIDSIENEGGENSTNSNMCNATATAESLSVQETTGFSTFEYEDPSNSVEPMTPKVSPLSNHAKTALLDIEIAVESMANFHRICVMVHDTTTRGLESRILRARLSNDRQFHPLTCIDPSKCYNFYLSDDGGGGAGSVSLTYDGRQIYGARSTPRGGNGFVATFGEGCPMLGDQRACVDLSLQVGVERAGLVRYKLEDVTDVDNAGNSTVADASQAIWQVDGLDSRLAFHEKACVDPEGCFRLTIENDAAANQTAAGATYVGVQYNGRSIYRPKDGNFGVRRIIHFGNGCL